MKKCNIIICKFNLIVHALFKSTLYFLYNGTYNLFCIQHQYIVIYIYVYIYIYMYEKHN